MTTFQIIAFIITSFASGILVGNKIATNRIERIIRDIRKELDISNG